VPDRPKEMTCQMADDKPKRKRRTSDDDRRKRTSDAGTSTRQGRLTGAQLANRAQRQLAEITGLQEEGVSSLARDDDGSWRVTVELLELSRVPDTDDVIGSYEVELDETGELIGYRRLRRYPRSQAGEGQGANGK
jgi:hypothetical protein